MVDFSKRFEEAPMNSSFQCPVCGGDPCADNSQRVRELCRRHGLVSEHCNPGGRELVFSEKGRLQLTDWCSLCDERTLRTFLGEL